MTPERRKNNNDDNTDADNEDDESQQTKKPRKDEPTFAVVFGPSLVRYCKSPEEAEKLAIDSDGELSLKKFNTWKEAIDFALEKKKEVKVQVATDSGADKQKTSNDTNSKSMSLTQIKEIVGKKLALKNGARIIISFKVVPNSNLIIIVIDICKDFEDDDGTKGLLVSTKHTTDNKYVQ